MVPILKLLRRAKTRMLKPFLRWENNVRLQRDISRVIQRGFVVRQTDFPARHLLSLPEKYGRGLPERVVELLLAKLVYQPGAELLDVGHANAMLCHLELLKALPTPKNITGIDIETPTYNISDYYEDSKLGDIANTDFESARFDCIWCISALEHFGMDNSGYTEDFSRDNECASKALCEMLRIVQGLRIE